MCDKDICNCKSCGTFPTFFVREVADNLCATIRWNYVKDYVFNHLIPAILSERDTVAYYLDMAFSPHQIIINDERKQFIIGDLCRPIVVYDGLSNPHYTHVTISELQELFDMSFKVMKRIPIK